MRKYLLIILFMGIVLISGCDKQTSDTKSLGLPLQPEITFLQTPKLNDVVDITITVKDIAKYKNETVIRLLRF